MSIGFLITALCVLNSSSNERTHIFCSSIEVPAFKYFHRQAVDAACITGCTDFNQVEFLAVMEEIRRKTFKISSVQSAFRKTGLYPFNPEEVLSVVRAEQQAQRSPSPSRQSTPETPATEQAQPKKRPTPRSV